MRENLSGLPITQDGIEDDFVTGLQAWVNSAEPGELRAEAMRRMIEARRDRSTHLSLDGLGLSSIPEQIGELTALTSLDLSVNQLTALPESIGGLNALTRLVLSFNQLTALPESIGGLNALTNLYLDGNRLTALPESIGGLNALTRLVLSFNQLTPSPALLDGLYELETGGCRIDYPDQITLQLRVDRAESRRLQKSRLQLESRTLLLSGLDDKSNFSKLDDEILKKIAEFTDTSLLSKAEIKAAFEATKEDLKQTERYKKHAELVTDYQTEVIATEEKRKSESSEDRAEEQREVTTARRTFVGRVYDSLPSIFPKTSIFTTTTSAQPLQNKNPLHRE